MKTKHTDASIGGAPTRHPKKPSAAAIVAVQARDKSNNAPNVELLPQSRVEIRLHAMTNCQQLVAIFPTGVREKPNEVDLSFLLDFPGVEPMFSSAFLCWGNTCEAVTRVTARDSLSVFFRYMKQTWNLSVVPHDIDDELLTDYRFSLLNNPSAYGKAYSHKTVTAYLGVLRNILGTLDTGVWAKSANAIASRVPSAPPSGRMKSIPLEALNLNSLMEVIEAAEKEILQVRERFSVGRTLIAYGRARPRLRAPLKKKKREGYGDFHDLPGCLEAVDRLYPGLIPALGDVQLQNPQLARSLIALHGYKEVCSYFFPSGRDLVPFVLLLAIATVFNAETVLKLDWSDVDFEREHAGRRAVEIKGEKRRARKDLVRLLDPEAAASSKLSLGQLLATLKDISLRMRKFLPERHADRLFVFVLEIDKCKNGCPRAFDSADSKRARTATRDIWDSVLKRFINENDLPKFSLSQLRPSVLNLVQFIHGDLETAQKVGNHSNPTTTWAHYTSDGVKKNYRQRIGQVIVMHERWFQTGGVIDPRRLSPNQEKGAATPGFSCLDPFNSPRPGQTQGKLCRDYGGCPSCPLAAAHPADPTCVGQYIALEHAIYRSQPAMSAKTWLDRWVPVLADLKALQTHIPISVLINARKVSFILPNVG